MGKFDITSRIKLEFSDVKPCTKKVSVKLAGADVTKGLENEAVELAKFAELPGFRQGKAPVFLVKNRFAGMIKEQLGRSIMSCVFDKLDKAGEDGKKEFDVLSYNTSGINSVEPKEGEDFAISFEFDVAPEFELPKYSEINVDLKKEAVSESEINDQIERLKGMYGKYEDCEGPVQENDMLELSVSSDATLPEEASDEAKRLVKSEKMWVWVREPEMIPNLNKAVIGKKNGEDFSFTAEYPADFREHALAGMKIKYEAKVSKVQRHSPLTDIDELCKKVKVAGFDELKERISKDLENMKTRDYEAAVKEKCVDEICARTKEFPLPDITLEQFVGEETNLYIRQNVANEEQAKEFKEKKEEHISKIREEAKKKLRKFLIMRKIASAEKINVEREDFDSEIRSLSRHFGVNEKDFRKNVSERMAERLHMGILESKVADFLAKKISEGKKQ
ncbi:MAG TPA: trigger factor [Victivallales bacterium]|nr:trigger factor [Victivallales bacterium]